MKYLSMRAELDAVESGAKGLSMFSWLRDDVESTEFLELLDLAMDRGLSIVLDPDDKIRKGHPRAEHQVRVYALRHDQLWRVPAMTAFLDTVYSMGLWNETAEAQMSKLLGYSDADRQVWMDWHRWNQVGWGCRTIYTLLDAEQRKNLDVYGHRTFGPPSSIEDMTFFLHHGDYQLKPTAARLVPRGSTLARVGIVHDLLRELFAAHELGGVPRHAILHGTVTKSIARRFNRAMRSTVQLLGPDGWST